MYIYIYIYLPCYLSRMRVCDFDSSFVSFDEIAGDCNACLCRCVWGGGQGGVECVCVRLQEYRVWRHLHALGIC